MTRRLARTIFFVVRGAILLSVTAAALAAPVPSKPAPAPATDSRDADSATVRSFLARENVARALAGTGLTAPQIEQRLAALSNEDLRALEAKGADEDLVRDTLDRILRRKHGLSSGESRRP